MLIGIVKKNAIMMIDFALEAQRRQGKDAAQAIYEGAMIRFRPIMMTTMAALMGTLPIAIGFGAGPKSETVGIGSCRRVNCLSTADALFYAGLLYLS